MNCLGKILHIVCFHLVLDVKYSSIGATPITGLEPIVRRASIDELLFIVSISANTFSNSGQEELNHICSGSLITHRYVLTAHHCLQGIQYSSDIVVKIGSNNLRDARAHAIEWWKTYSDWANITSNIMPPSNSLSYYDIAIVKLHDVASSDIPLPWIKYTYFDHFIGKNAISGGWGYIEGNKSPRHKRIGKFYVLSPDQCAYSMYKQYFCTSALLTRLTSGDSGGPLLLKDRKSIIGVNKAICKQKGASFSSDLINVHGSIIFAEQFIHEVTKM